jgi:hypothetical protein
MSWLFLSTALCTITSLAIWSRRPTRARGLAVIALLAIVPISGGLLASERGWPVTPLPLLADLPEGEMTVHGVSLVPEAAIFLMLDVGQGPRLFALPWNAEAASKLQRLMEGREGSGEIKATKRTGLTDEDAFPLELHGAPQPSHPDKLPETSMRYERQGE